MAERKGIIKFTVEKRTKRLKSVNESNMLFALMHLDESN